jgi:uncharacterized protein
MKISGSATVRAPVGRVWDALNDPAVLVRTIPGCQRLESTGTDKYRMSLEAGVASIKGIYQGEVALSDQQAPGSFRLKASGAGAPGTVSADVQVNLAEIDSGSTRVEYTADAVIGGMVGGVGQRVLMGVANKTAAQFFAAVDADLNGAESGTDTPAPSSLSDAVAGAGPGPGRKVFTAPVASTPAGMNGEFAKGAVFGAAIALLGIGVGAFIGRRR